jgi:hypothetical protein
MMISHVVCIDWYKNRKLNIKATGRLVVDKDYNTNDLPNNYPSQQLP